MVGETLTKMPPKPHDLLTPRQARLFRGVMYMIPDPENYDMESRAIYCFQQPSHDMMQDRYLRYQASLDPITMAAEAPLENLFDYKWEDLVDLVEFLYPLHRDDKYLSNRTIITSMQLPAIKSNCAPHDLYPAMELFQMQLLARLPGKRSEQEDAINLTAVKDRLTKHPDVPSMLVMLVKDTFAGVPIDGILPPPIKTLTRVNSYDSTLDSFFNQLLRRLEVYMAAYAFSKSLGLQIQPVPPQSSPPGKTPHAPPTPPLNPKPAKAQRVDTVSNPNQGAPRVACTICGRMHPSPCVFNAHPDANHTGLPWTQSEKGKAFAAPTFTYRGISGTPVLPADVTLQGTPLNPPIVVPPSKKQNNKHNHSGKPKGHHNKNCECDDCITMLSAIVPPVMPMPTNDVACITATLNMGKNSKDINAYVDTCAGTDLISHATAEWLQAQGYALSPTSQPAMCSPMQSNGQRMCFSPDTCVHNVNVTIPSAALNTPYTFTIPKLIVAPINVPLIIGYNTIRNEQLLIEHLPDLLVSAARSSSLTPPLGFGGVTATAGTADPIGSTLASLTTTATPSAKRSNPTAQSAAAEDTRQLQDFNTRMHVDKDDVFPKEFYEDFPWEIDTNNKNSTDRASAEATVANPNIPTAIYGDETLRTALTSLCVEYSDIFSRQLTDTPARVEEYRVEADLKQWHSNKNRQPPRQQTPAKEEEIRKQITAMLAAKVIERTGSAPAYSQVHLVPKPNSKWRFCIDFRNLNSVCTSHTWPIPNINTMIQRIGAKKPKYFATMDLTQGYFQVAVTPMSRALTAFICFMGTFVWTRLPMGLKGAASHFQQQIASVVLMGLLYIICESYIDDILTHGNSPEELVANLRQVFQRFRDYNITLNPDKCKFGLTTIPFVGHILSHEGITFDRTKIDKLVDFTQPTTWRGMKQFIGLANTFRDHIRNHSILAYPLQQMILGYTKQLKNKRLEWKPALEANFRDLKQAIDHLPTLYFIDPTAPIYLNTDACDYGIGAYLFQKVDNREIPIAFISKSLAREQLRWATPTKEAYAMYYAFVKLEYLLGDNKFIVQTDHINLTYISSTGDPKVVRWRLRMQGFNADYTYLKGELNHVSDDFSRLCEHIDDPAERATVLAFITQRFDTAPRNIRHYDLIASVHNTKVGHGGIELTMSRLLPNAAAGRPQGLTWPGMREDVTHFIRRCPCCQKMSQHKIAIHAHHFVTSANHPMEIIHVDTIGPLPVDKNGYKYILAIIDSFSRYLMLFKLKSLIALEASAHLIHWASIFGAPLYLHSDNGTQFRNDLFKQFTTIMGCQHSLTTPYSHQENAIVERSHRETLKHLKSFVHDDNTTANWSDYIDCVARIHNSHVHSTTGVSPSQLIFGNAINPERGMFVGPLRLPESAGVDVDLPMRISQHVANLMQSQYRYLQHAQHNQQMRDDKHFAANPTPFVTVFPVNSYVLAKHPDGHAPNKLTPQWRGPYRVMSQSGNQYVVLDLVSNIERILPLSHLRPFYLDGFTPPFDVARRDTTDVVVDAVIAHAGDPKKLSSLEFLVRYLDLDESHNQWQPWKNMRNNPALHAYLRTNNLAKLVPKEHRNAIQ
jgi:transposase InsO family protein